MKNNLVRKNNALVNSDRNAYMEAKARKKQKERMDGIEEKINTIESNMTQILQHLKEMNSK